MENNIIRFGLVGCGAIARIHAAALADIEDARLVCVCDHLPAAAQAFAKAWGTSAALSLDAMLADPSIDAVCICTPSGLHAAQAERVIRSGKHVLVEKPLALSVQDCDRISAAARSRGLLVGVVSQLRFSPAVRKVRTALENGLLGRICSADLYMKYYRSQDYYDSNGWRGTVAMDGGGALMNQGIHGVDLLHWLMGPVRSISALSGTLIRDIEVEDTMNAIVKFQNGAFGVIQAMTAAYPGFPRRLEFNGEYGCIILEEDRVVKWEIDGEPAYRDYEESAPIAQSHNDPGRIDKAGHIRQYRNFMGAIRGEEALQVSDRDGRATLEIIEGAYTSAREQRPVLLAQEPLFEENQKFV